MTLPTGREVTGLTGTGEIPKVMAVQGETSRPLVDVIEPALVITMATMTVAVGPTTAPTGKDRLSDPGGEEAPNVTPVEGGVILQQVNATRGALMMKVTTETEERDLRGRMSGPRRNRPATSHWTSL